VDDRSPIYKQRADVIRAHKIEEEAYLVCRDAGKKKMGREAA
jgi:hypothetical protein